MELIHLLLKENILLSIHCEATRHKVTVQKLQSNQGLIPRAPHNHSADLDHKSFTVGAYYPFVNTHLLQA